MFKLYVLQNRQLILTLGVGLVLVLSFFLSYLPMKRPRDPLRYQSSESPGPSTWREVWSCIPWILILVYVGTFIYSIIDIAWKSVHPPNY
jgi:ABC-type Fe3+-siderophore transport system permease subunit